MQASANEDLPFDEYGVRVNSSEANQQLLADEEWVNFDNQTDVALDKVWKINFSAIATPNKIKAITIEHKDKPIKVIVNYNSSKIVTVKPDKRFIGSQNYTLKILLTNGKKYKMDFVTTKADKEPNNTYKQASILYVDETIQGDLLVNSLDKTDFYKINVPRDGQLNVNIRRLDTANTVSLYLYGVEGNDGDLLAYAENKTSALIFRELKAGDYYIQVSGSGRYEIKTSFAAKTVKVEDALQSAQDAVFALPAPMDVTAEHNDAIRTALTLIATAKAVGADPVALEKIEAIVAELQKIVQPIEMTVSVLNSTTFEVRFNRAVDGSVAQFEVTKKGDAAITKPTVTFNANKTVAKVEMPSKLNIGLVNIEYTLGVTGLDSGILATKVSVKPETVASIEIPGNYANRTTLKEATIDYKVKNQYGEDITGTTTIQPVAKASMTALDATVDKVDVTSNGKVTITTTDAQEGDSVTLTLAHGEISVTKIVKITAQASVEGIKILGVYNAKDEKLKETTNLDINDPKEKFYLLIEAKDQYDKLVTDLSILNTPNVLRLDHTNPTIVKFAAITGIVEVKDKNGAPKGIGLPLTGTPKLGESVVTLTAIASGKKASHKVTVAESTRTDGINLIVPTRIPEGEDILITIEAKDKAEIPNLITDPDIIKSAVSGIKFIVTPTIPYTIETNDPTSPISPTNPTGIWMKFDKSNVKKGSFTIKAESSTKKVDTKTITVEGKAVPWTWDWNKNLTAPIQTEIEVKKPADHLSQEISKFVQVFDQYGKLVVKPFEVENSSYSLVVTDENPAGGAVEVKAGVVTTRAIGTEKVTIAILKDGKPVANSLKPVTFKVTNGSGFVSYKVEDIGTVYDEFATGKEGIGSDGAYSKKVKVMGITENGSIRPFTGYTVEFDVTGAYTANNDLNITEDVSKQLHYQSNTTKIRMTVMINSTKETYIQDVIVSKEPPKVESLQLWEKGKKLPLQSLSYDPVSGSGKEAFNFTKLREEADIVAIDQYGVKVVLDKDGNLEFPDGTEIDSVLKFTTSSDGLIFTQNGTKDAAVTELPSGASFNTVLSAGTKSSNTVIVTVVGIGHTLVADAAKAELVKETAKIIKGKLGTLENGSNIIAQAQVLVGDGYTVTINSSSNPSVVNIDGKVMQQAEPKKVTVVFTVTKGKYSVNTAPLNLDVDRAPLIDKSGLIAKIADANAIYVAVSVNGSGSDIEPTENWTTRAEKTALETAVIAAQAVNARVASQSEVDGASAALEVAIGLYKIAAEKLGIGSTGKIGAVSTITNYVPETPAVKAEFIFAAPNGLTKDDKLEIGGQLIPNVTDATTIVAEIKRRSLSYDAKAEGSKIILIQITAKEELQIPTVTVTSGGTVSNETVLVRTSYVPAKPATPAEFTFEVITDLLETDILKIGNETYTSVMGATTIIAKITASSTSKYMATGGGKTITLTQKVPAQEVAPTITVSK